MDNLDAWIKRAFDEGSVSHKDSQAKTEPKKDSKASSNSKKHTKTGHNTGNNTGQNTGQKPGRRHKNRRPQKTLTGQSKSAHSPRTNHAARGKSQATHTPHDAKAPQKPQKNHPILKGKLKIIPLGGLDEVGKNMMAFEYEDDIIVLDMGLEFPSEDMLGIDYVIPDVTYLEERKKRIRGIVITHGHLDHIGGAPYILPRLDFPPVFGPKLAMGLVQKRIEEFKQEKYAKINTINTNDVLKLGKFTVKFFHVSHSFPDAFGVVIETPAGKIVHTGDFKFDETPASPAQRADMDKIRALGSQNILALFSDSTNALRPGHTMSEKQVGEKLDELIGKAQGRLVIASFSTLIGRIQQILDAAVKHNKKVFVSGRSMRDNIDISAKLGYLKFPRNLVQDIKKYGKAKTADNETLILTTGSQGESVSALTRIANNDHPHIKIKKGDTIILSSSPIVGNERAIFSVINNLCMKGAKVIHNQISDVHTSGHGHSDELVEMMNYVKPKYFLPVHGEYFMRQGHAILAKERGRIPENNIIMLQNGDVLLCGDGKVERSKETIETKYILIDGLGEGHVGSQVQMDREIMSQNGALMVLIYVSRKTRKATKDPDVLTRGFIYMHETREITDEITRLAKEAYKTIQAKNPGADRKDIKKYIRQTVDKYTRQKLERRPLIVPIIVET